MLKAKKRTEKLRKLIKTVEFVVVEYWACAIDSHRHKLESHAIKCINSSMAKERALIKKAARDKRNKLIMNDYDDGLRKAHIARKYGISNSVVAIVVNKETRKRRRADML